MNVNANVNKYQRGKIYKIFSPLTEEIYIGSTCEPTLARRMAGHRSSFQHWLAGTGGYTSSFKLLELADYDIVLLESFPCNNKDELHAREQHYIDLHQGVCVNRQKAFTGLTKQEYNAQHRVQYYAANRDAIADKHTQYYEANKDAIAERQAQYYTANRDTITAIKRVKHACACGGKYTNGGKTMHSRTQKHKKWQSQVDYRQSLIDRLTALFGEEDWTGVSIADMIECIND